MNELLELNFNIKTWKIHSLIGLWYDYLNTFWSKTANIGLNPSTKTTTTISDCKHIVLFNNSLLCVKQLQKCTEKPEFLVRWKTENLSLTKEQDIQGVTEIRTKRKAVFAKVRTKRASTWLSGYKRHQRAARRYACAWPS